MQAANDEEGVVDWCVSVNIVTGSTAQADFEVFFAPQGRHVAPIGVKLSIDCKQSATGNKNLHRK